MKILTRKSDNGILNAQFGLIIPICFSEAGMMFDKYNWYLRKIHLQMAEYRCEIEREGNNSDSDELIEVKSYEKTSIKPKTPRMYRVILHNDDYTTMDFVIDILVSVFSKPAAEATRIMLDIHQRGKGECGIYIHDIAMTKVNQVHQQARKNQFPLKCSLEKA